MQVWYIRTKTSWHVLSRKTSQYDCDGLLNIGQWHLTTKIESGLQQANVVFAVICIVSFAKNTCVKVTRPILQNTNKNHMFT